MRVVIGVVAGLALSGCLVGDAPPPSSSPPARSDAAPDVLGRGIERLQAYGQDHLDEFGGLYVDPPGGQHVVMLFTENLDEHALAVETILPGTTLRQVEHTEAELTRLLESLDFDALASQGVELVTASVDVIGNRVTLEAKSNDITAEARLELAYGGLLDVTIFPVPGAWRNVAEGDGWRLLATGESRTDAYVVRAATDEAAYGRLWDAAGIGGDAPAVDLATEAVVSFAHGIGSGCPEVRLDGVHIADGIVWSITSDPLEPRGCTADLAGAAVFVVAIAHEAVPDGFTLWLSEYAASRGGEFSAPVMVDIGS
jgi:hypothetical protein